MQQVTNLMHGHPICPEKLLRILAEIWIGDEKRTLFVNIEIVWVDPLPSLY